MTNTIGVFTYTLSKMSAKDEGLPVDPFLVIHLKHGGRAKSDGSPAVSGTLVSAEDIDEHIRNLKADLDAVADAAKRALKQARKATAEIVRQRSED